MIVGTKMSNMFIPGHGLGVDFKHKPQASEVADQAEAVSAVLLLTRPHWRPSLLISF